MNYERTFEVKPLTAFVNHAIYGAGGGGGGSARAPIEAPDSLRSIAYARILDLVSEGEIYGFADQTNPLTCVYLNETPVQNADGSLNFKNIQIDSRVGTQTQDYIKGFGGVENELIVGVELRADTPYTRAVTNLNLSAVRVRLSVPALQKTDTTNGDVNGYNVAYALDLSVDGGSFIQVFRGSFSGKASSKYERTHRIDLPAANTGWQVRVRRTTPDTDDTYIQDTTIVESMAEIIDAKFRLPMSAVVGVVVDAEQFNNIPSRAYDIKGRLVRVPSNYDPDTRTYTGIWDGTFQTAWSDNPAWCFYDMALHSRYGLGHLLTPAMVNKWNLYRISQYCDGMVDDGFGGLEPRFTINTCLETQEDATRVMMNLATVFRGIMYAAGGELVAVGDMPEDPKYTYTPSNVIDGKFVYAGSGRKVRHTVALVSWSDQSDFGRQKIEYIQDEDGIARYGIQQTEVIAFGCTSRGQARRLGKYILTTERYETDGISFSVGLDGTLCPPGTIVYVSDPLRAGRRTGGRMRSTTITTVTVDALPIGSVGDKLVAILPSGKAEDRPISNIAGNTFTVSPAFSDVPVPGSVWAIESDELPLQRFRVLSVIESTDETRVGHDVTAIQHVEGKFAYVEDGIMIDVPSVPDVPSSTVPSPTGIGVEQRTVADANTTQVIVNLFWTKVASAVNYTAKWRQNDGNWIDLGTVTAVNVDIPNVQPGPFEVQVTAVNALGVKSVPAFGGPFDITGNTTPPGYVQDLIDTDAILSTNLAQEVIDRVSGDAATSAAAASALATEAATRAADDLAVANAAATALLDAQTTLEAAIATEQTIRQSEDESLASQIATVSAGTGEQFDSNQIWYFDTSAESWTGNGSPTVVDGFLRPANHATDPYVQSATGIAIDGGMYRYAKMRVKRTGTPAWAGELRAYAVGGALVSGSPFVVPEPTWDSNGIATIDFKDLAWSGMIDRIRLDLTTVQSAAHNIMFDWIAVGRPSPGASAAALQTETTARINADAAEVTARQTLATQMRGSYTGTDVASLTSGLVYSERQARVTADSAMATDITALDVRMDDAEADISATASAVSALDVRVDSVEGVNTSQASSITSLNSRMTAAEGVNTSQASALTSLDSRVTAAEGVNTSQASSITSLNSRMTAAEGVNTSQATAISGLTTRVTDAENELDVQATNITSLQAGINGIGGDNLLTNSGFETDADSNTVADGWTTAGTLSPRTASLVASPVAGSTLAQRLSGTTTGAGQYIEISRAVANQVKVNEGDVLTLSVMARGTAGKQFRMYIQFKNAGGTVLATATLPATNITESFTRYVLTSAAAPAGTTQCGVYVGRIFGVNSGEALFLEVDNAQLQIGSVATAWAPSALEIAATSAAAVSSLDARVTSAEGNISSTSSALTALTATVGTKANATAVTALEARVTAAEGVNTSQASAITSINSSLDAQANLVANSNGNTGTAGWSSAGSLTIVPATSGQPQYLSSAPSAVSTTRVHQYEVPVVAGRAYSVSADMYVASGSTGSFYIDLIFQNAGGTTLLDTTNIVAAANSTWQRLKLENQVAPATATKVLVRVVAQSAIWSGVWGFRRVKLELGSVVTPYSEEGATQNIATATTALQTTVSDLDGKVNASYTLTLDVNGYITGYKVTNTGATSGMDVVVDNFRLLKPGGGARIEMSSGNIRTYDASNVLRVRMGVW